MNRLVSLGELLSKYKTIRHFCEAYRAAGKLIIDEEYVSWYYVRQIVIGEKLIVNNEDQENLSIPPRLAKKFKRYQCK